MLSNWKQIKKNWNESLWRKNFKKRYSGLYEYEGNDEKLRFILGPGRSGTSWLSQVLAKSTTPMRFFNEPLFHMDPKLTFSNKFDHTAIPYCSKLDTLHPLVKTYKSLPFLNHAWSEVLPPNILLRDDKDFAICLVKEVHSLLATEALMSQMRCKTLFITRNPLYVVDSFCAARGVNAPGYKNEVKYINTDLFLDKYFSSQANTIKRYFKINAINSTERGQVIVCKAITIAIINKMLEIIAGRFKFILHITYEDICASPYKVFSKAADFLSLEFQGKTIDYLKRTQEKDNNSDDPYSIFRNTNQQLNRPFKFLSNDEVAEVTDILRDCNL